MKMGIRTPLLKKSFSARTKGKLTRSIKKITSPAYGKKGIGIIKNPKKALYNKVYNATTISITDLTSHKSTSKIAEQFTAPYTGVNKMTEQSTQINDIPITGIYNGNSDNDISYPKPSDNVLSIKSKKTALLLCVFFGYFGVHRFYTGKTVSGLIWLVTFGVFGFGWIADIFIIASGRFTDKFNGILK